MSCVRLRMPTQSSRDYSFMPRGWIYRVKSESPVPYRLHAARSGHGFFRYPSFKETPIVQLLLKNPKRAEQKVQGARCRRSLSIIWRRTGRNRTGRREALCGRDACSRCGNGFCRHGAYLLTPRIGKLPDSTRSSIRSGNRVMCCASGNAGRRRARRLLPGIGFSGKAIRQLRLLPGNVGRKPVYPGQSISRMRELISQFNADLRKRIPMMRWSGLRILYACAASPSCGFARFR